MTDTNIALIIDDNPLNNDVLVTLLEGEAFSPIAIESPRLLEATLDTMEGTPRVIFLDLEFPNHDGFEVLRSLKHNPALAGIPIIAYSVHTSEIDRARQAGFDGFLGKPLNAQAFRGQLQNILTGESVWEI